MTFGQTARPRFTRNTCKRLNAEVFAVLIVNDMTMDFHVLRQILRITSLIGSYVQRLPERTLVDISKVLSDAIKAVEEADVPDDLRQVAFEKAVELAARSMVPVEPDGLAGGADSQAANGTQDPADPLARIAGKLGLPLDLVGDVFYIDSGELGIGLPTSSFDRTKAGATKQLALVIAAGRQAAGLDEWTSSAVIRAMCQEYGRFDSANFATTLRSIGSAFSYRGKGFNLEVRLTRPGLERASELIRELTASQ
jgi:hypothetical protein